MLVLNIEAEPERGIVGEMIFRLVSISSLIMEIGVPRPISLASKPPQPSISAKVQPPTKFAPQRKMASKVLVHFA